MKFSLKKNLLILEQTCSLDMPYSQWRNLDRLLQIICRRCCKAFLNGTKLHFPSQMVQLMLQFILSNGEWWSHCHLLSTVTYFSSLISSFTFASLTYFSNSFSAYALLMTTTIELMFYGRLQ